MGFSRLGWGRFGGLRRERSDGLVDKDGLMMLGVSGLWLGGGRYG
jgi:hypothetical protein